MGAYLLKRLLLIVPTMLGIMTIVFVIVQSAPGGPIDRIRAQQAGLDTGVGTRISGGEGDGQTVQGQGGDPSGIRTRAGQGLPPEFVKQLEKQFGFDKPLHERFLLMLRNYTCIDIIPALVVQFPKIVTRWQFTVPETCFNFGRSYFRSTSVLELIREKLPVSISLGLWMMLITYAIAIPLGIRKAVRDGERFDVWTSGVLVVGYAVPGFLFAVLLLVLFAGGSFFQWFPLRGLTAGSWQELPRFLQSLYPDGARLGAPGRWLPWYWIVVDYLWHLMLPIIAMAIGAFTTLTFLTKNSFLDEIRKQYVLTARAKGLTERQTLYGHVFRNAMLLVIAGIPSAFVHAFFSGSLLIENIFSLDGLGLLSLDSILNRDYPVIFASLYIFSLVGLVLNLVTDFIYTLVDPRIDFESREV